MEREALKRIFNFLEKKEGYNAPLLWKLENDIPITKKDLNVKDNLNLRWTRVTSLPEGLKVGGGLDLSGSDITSLPKGLKVGRYLDLSYSNITSLPEVLEVGDNLYIWGTPLTKYTNDELREMIKPGFIEGVIFR